ncbi:MAG: hypothetical protein ACE15B_23455 [Bryobacteraceae bacterium]
MPASLAPAPSFVQPGHSDFVRLNPGLAPEAGAVGALLANAILASSPRESAPIYV